MDDFAGNAEAEEARKWISAIEARALLGLSQDYFLEQAKERGYTRRQAYRYGPIFYLRREIESWADFRQMRRQWLAKYPGDGGGKRYRERIDAEVAQRIFIGTKEAAELLSVSVNTVRGMVRTGRLVCYKSHSKGPVRLWFSRRAVLQIAEDPERLRRRANRLGASQGQEAGQPCRRQWARMAHEGVPKGWLTAREAAARLGVCVGRVRTMRLTGRLRGEQIWRRNKPLKFWYFPDYEVERAISWRQQAKEARLPPPDSLALTPNPSPNSGRGESMQSSLIANALPIPATGEGGAMPRSSGVEAPFVSRVRSPFRLDADGPEPEWACDDADGLRPKWACDDEELTRAFFRLDRPGD